jgi:hypothetical protein
MGGSSSKALRVTHAGDSGQEAGRVLSNKVQELRGKSYTELSAVHLNKPVGMEVIALSGASVRAEVKAVWDHPKQKSGNLRVIVSVSYGGLSNFLPLTGSFIMAPGGSFVGE